MGSFHSEIRSFLATTLNRDPSGITDADSLLEAGVIDSLGVMELVGYLEQRYGVQVSEDDMMPENFDSVDAIAAFVNRRLNGSGD